MTLQQTAPGVQITDYTYRDYPESDGKPMAETDVHRDQMVYLIEALKARYRERNDVYVAGNLLLYYEEGDVHSRVAPDVMVVFGAARRQRRTYRLWEEGLSPTVVFEISSRSTRSEDLWQKRGLYEFLGVKEYFLYDPVREYLEPPLQGYRLVEGHFQALTAEQSDRHEWRLYSEQLGLALVTEQRVLLRLYDPDTGEKLLTPLEAQLKASKEAEQRQRAEEAESRIAELEAELARLRGEE
jgi:Uma2 family endonuclease